MSEETPPSDEKLAELAKRDETKKLKQLELELAEIRFEKGAAKKAQEKK